jgi:hypothetical protein
MAASNRNYREIELNGTARAYLRDMLNDGLSLGKALASSPQASGWLTPAAGWARVNEGRT